MNFEVITNIVKGTKGGDAGSVAESEKPGNNEEKSQEFLRSALENKLKSTKPLLEDGIKEYKQALKDGLFEDGKDEKEGSGEKRKEKMQRKLNTLVERAEKMKSQLDSGETLSLPTPELSTTFTRSDGKVETISLNIESKLKEFTSFYQKTKVDLPPNFEDDIYDIWNRNQDNIEKAMEEGGFDDMLLVPGNIPLPELAEKMKMEDGYYFFQTKDDFPEIQSTNVDKPRIILVHHTDTLPEITKKTGLDIHLNITGKDAESLYDANPDKCLSTLEDFLILEKKYFEETGKHLSDYETNSANWLPGSISGVRLVYSYWHPGHHKLHVGALGPSSQYEDLGVRLARCFF